MSSTTQPISNRIASKLFEIELREPSKRSRTVLWIVSALFLLLVLWAMFAKLDIVAVASGRLVPQTYVKIVQPAEAGVIREILVREGDEVAADEVLVRLDPTINTADRQAVARELAIEQLQLRRIEADLAGEVMSMDPADDPVLFAQVQAQHQNERQALLDTLAQEQAAKERALKELIAANELLKKLETTLPSYERTAQAYAKLAKDNLVGAIQAEERQREAIEKAQDLEAQRATVASLEATVRQSEERLAQIKSTHTSELSRARLETVASINRLEQQLEKLAYQQGLLQLRAPQAGVVKELATTTLGAVVEPGTVLLSLVPQDDSLVAEVRIENKDIGFVVPGQPVRVKVAAYQFQKYGMLEGVVKTVSADSSAQQSQGSEADHLGLTFKALLHLSAQQLSIDQHRLPLAAGMQVSAEIVQGRRTVLEYLLSPVQRVASESATER